MEKKFFFQVSLIALIITGIVDNNIGQLKEYSISDPPKNSFRLFEDEEPLDITLRYDLSSYFRNQPKEGYLKANITFHLSKTDSISKDIRLRSRGIFRKGYCNFPPIELNFKKIDFGYSDLNKISKLKMVPQCKQGTENEKYVLKEYLIYKLFNLMTDTSFRVRLLRVTYIDTEKERKKNFTQYGFFIEPIKMLTERTNTIQIKSKALNQKNIYPYLMDRLAIFNYMIGNFDYSIPGQHNVKVIKPLIIDPRQLGIAVPYDFDWTGFVNAAYAIPDDEVVGVKKVTDRLFLGICRSREVYEKEIQVFVTMKDKFYKVVNEFPYLDKRDKKEITDYLDEFYDHLTGYNSVIDIFLRTCKIF